MSTLHNTLVTLALLALTLYHCGYRVLQDTPDELALLPLDEFSALDTGEVEELLAAVEGANKPCNLLAVSHHMPPAMVRKHWSLEDYALVKHMVGGGA